MAERRFDKLGAKGRVRFAANGKGRGASPPAALDPDPRKYGRRDDRTVAYATRTVT